MMDDVLYYDTVSVTSSDFESRSDQSEINSVGANVEIDVRTLKENDNDQNNNIDDLALTCNNSKETEDTIIKAIKEETRQICLLLPKFNYSFVYNKLYRVRYAQNRVEICLWNLLPDQVPRAKWFPRFNNGNSTLKTSEMSDWRKKNTIKNDISNNSPNIINVKHLLNNYLAYFEFMQHNKRAKLESGQHFDISARNDIRTNFLTSQCVNDKQNTFESLYKDLEPGTLDVDASQPEILDVDANESGILDVDAHETEILDVDANEPGILDVDAEEPEILDVDANEPGILDVDANEPEILDVDANEPGILDVDANEPEILDVDANEPGILDVDANEPEILDIDGNSVSSNASTTMTNITATSIHKNIPRTQTIVETTLDNTDLNNSRRKQVIAGTEKKINPLAARIAAFRKKKSENGNIMLPGDQRLHMAEPRLHARITQNKQLRAVKTDTQAEKQEISNDSNNRFIYLSGVFPNADPEFLKRVVLRANGNHNIITDFVESQCKEPTYPTKSEKLKRTEITKQQEQYTVEFDVKHFLKIFPNPFLHFENKSRKCTYHPDALQFLQFYFNQFNIATLSQVYQKHNYHLTLAAQELETMVPERQLNCKKSMWERNPTEHIPLLQECAFIKYKNEIRKYLDQLMEEEQREFQNLKRRNELLECSCCFNNECMPSKCSTCDDGHIFCHECIIKGVELTIAQGGSHIKCFVDSTDEFTLPVLQEILKPSQFSILIRKRQEAEVKAADLEGLVSCPFCHFASIPPKEDKVFKCFNPECMKESCRLCKEPNHVPAKCNEKSENARLFLEEKMTEAIVRKCCNCGRPYVKEYGCNKITCSCGAVMCYLCNKQIFGYDHFKGACPLHTNDTFIDATTVQEVAKKTVAFIQSKDPNIKINTTGLVAKNQFFDARNPVVLRRLNRIKFDTS